jgi:hypothetical protein
LQSGGKNGGISAFRCPQRSHQQRQENQSRCGFTTGNLPDSTGLWSTVGVRSVTSNLEADEELLESVLG